MVSQVILDKMSSNEFEFDNKKVGLLTIIFNPRKMKYHLFSNVQA